MFENTNKLSGAIVGIGFIKNGVLDYKELDKPIRNKITSVGIDHLLTYDGTNACFNTGSSSSDTYGGYSSKWVGTRGVRGYYSGSTYYSASGVINYAAYGSGNTPTTFTDTALANKTSEYTSTKVTGSSQYCGVKSYSDQYGKYSYRVTYQFPTETSTKSINEIGFFGKFYNQTTSTFDYYMFSRVVLPQTLTIEEGTSLVVTYQVDETNAYNTATEIPFFGLKDTSGNDLYAQAKLYRIISSGVGSWGSGPINGDGGINSNGTNFTDFNGYYGKAFMPFITRVDHPGYNSFSYGDQFGWSTNESITLPNDNSTASMNPVGCDFSIDITDNYTNCVAFRLFTPYVCTGQTGKYRDIKLVLGKNFGKVSGENYVDITFLSVNGMNYRFGYYDNGTFVPQALRKYANKAIVFTSRTRYTTDDTTNDVYTNANEVNSLYALVQYSRSYLTYPYVETYPSSTVPTFSNMGNCLFTTVNPASVADTGTEIAVSDDPSMLRNVVSGCTITTTSSGYKVTKTSSNYKEIGYVERLF